VISYVISSFSEYSNFYGKIAFPVVAGYMLPTQSTGTPGRHTIWLAPGCGFEVRAFTLRYLESNDNASLRPEGVQVERGVG